MDEIAQALSKYWPLLLTFVGLIVWFTRLESKVKSLERHNENDGPKERAVWDKFDSLQSTLTAVLQAVARVEGRLQGSHLEKD